MGSIRQKEALRKILCQTYCLLISKQSQECFPKDEQNVLKRNWLVAYHTDIVLIINVEINIIGPDMNETYQECFPKDEQNVLKRNWLVAYHTDIVLIINVEINIIGPDMNETYQ